MRSPPAGAARGRSTARAALIWAIVAVVAAQLALTAATDTYAPEVYDPLYAARLNRLRAKRTEHPDRPLLVMLGSSRTCAAFRAELLPPMTASDGRAVLPFNFSRAGGGPIYCRFAYDRLRQQGFTPEWAVIELMPAMFEKNSERYFCPSITAYELSDLGGYISHRRAFSAYAKRHLLPWRSARLGLVREFAPSWVTPSMDGADQIDELGGEGPRLSPGDVVHNPPRKPPAANLKEVLSKYRVDPDIGRAFHDLLDACRRHGVGVIVVLTPESEYLRAAYPPEGLADLDRYCAGLTHEFGVRVLDARCWLAEEHFWDDHHANWTGQRVFTERLHREVLVPLIAGRFEPALAEK